MKDPSREPVILSIETATPVCSVALHSGSKMIGLSETFTDKTHSTNLIPMIMKILESNRIAYQDLNAVAVSRGPGSYTGLRIGISTAKGICFARDIPLISVGTLEALAQQVIEKNSNKNSIICPMLDARRMEVYTLLCKADGTVIEPVHAKIIDSRSFKEYLNDNTIIFAGPGAAKCESILSGSPYAAFDTGITASAKTIGDIAVNLYAQGIFENTELFEPFYLKEFQTTVPKQKI